RSPRFSIFRRQTHRRHLRRCLIFVRRTHRTNSTSNGTQRATISSSSLTRWSSRLQIIPAPTAPDSSHSRRGTLPLSRPSLNGSLPRLTPIADPYSSTGKITSVLTHAIYRYGDALTAIP